MYSSGQAMVEFTVALVVVMILLAGLIQMNWLIHAHTRTMIAARAAAGLLAMAPNAPVGPDPLLIYDWLAGPDMRQQTPDDIPLVTSNAASLPAELVAYASLGPGMPTNALTTLAASANPAADFFMVLGQGSEPVSILSIINRLVYPRPSLDVESEAWLVWAEGIY